MVVLAAPVTVSASASASASKSSSSSSSSSSEEGAFAMTQYGSVIYVSGQFEVCEEERQRGLIACSVSKIVIASSEIRNTNMFNEPT
jgi:hypothetical protein